MLIAVLLIAAAAPVDVLEDNAHVAPARNFVNLRFGGTAGGAAGTPAVCLETTPLEMIGVEACGNGSGFLHHENTPEIAQFKAKVRGPAYKRDDLWIEPWLGAGFAELQIADDAPGFYFTSTGPRGVETAGPLVMLDVRALMPLGGGFELVGDVAAGGAFFVEAPRLAVPQSPWQLLVTASLGVGF
jgi:hypothetical protein